MYKETAKCKKNALIPIAIWILSVYVCYILWGIAEILIGYSSPFIFKHLIFFISTAIFGFIIINKFLIQYEFSADKNAFEAYKILGKRKQLTCSIKYEDIIEISDDKSIIKKYDFKKKLNFIRAYQSGKMIYMAYLNSGETHLAVLKVSRGMLNHIMNNYNGKEGK